jgi:hypothetical protein
MIEIYDMCMANTCPKGCTRVDFDLYGPAGGSLPNIGHPKGQQPGVERALRVDTTPRFQVPHSLRR